MCTCVDVDADSSPVVAARVKALIWRIIQDSYGVLTHPSNTKGVTGREGGPQRCEGRKKIGASLELLRLNDSATPCVRQMRSVKIRYDLQRWSLCVGVFIV